MNESKTTYRQLRIRACLVMRFPNFDILKASSNFQKITGTHRYNPEAKPLKQKPLTLLCWPFKPFRSIMKNFSAPRYLKNCGLYSNRTCQLLVIYTISRDPHFKVTHIHYLQFPQRRTVLCFRTADLRTCKNRKLPNKSNVRYVSVTQHLS